MKNNIFSWRFWASVYPRIKHRAMSYDSYALERLDKKLLHHLNFKNGTFVEIGANDGVKQSNTCYFERKLGWTGILIEPIPETAERCRKNRPRSIVFNYACSDPETAKQKYLEFNHCDLMSFIVNSLPSEAEQAKWIEAGERAQAIKAKTIKVPVTTLGQLLDEAGCTEFDLLSLDVEGHEISVLKGLDLSKHRPKWILVEVLLTPLESVLGLVGEQYALHSMLTKGDALLRRKSLSNA